MITESFIITMELFRNILWLELQINFSLNCQDTINDFIHSPTLNELLQNT